MFRIMAGRSGFTDDRRSHKDRASPTSGSGIRTVDVLFVYGED